MSFGKFLLKLLYIAVVYLSLAFLHAIFIIIPLVEEYPQYENWWIALNLLFAVIEMVIAQISSWFVFDEI